VNSLCIIFSQELRATGRDSGPWTLIERRKCLSTDLLYFSSKVLEQRRVQLAIDQDSVKKMNRSGLLVNCKWAKNEPEDFLGWLSESAN
jgi:hypothetical protein